VISKKRLGCLMWVGFEFSDSCCVEIFIVEKVSLKKRKRRVLRSVVGSLSDFFLYY